MQAFYSERYVIALPPHHAFPIQKYAHLHRRLVGEGTLAPAAVLEPEPASRADILRVHTPEYHDRFVSGTLGAAAILRLGLPWSESLVGRARVSVGGTLGAARAALRDGIAANLGGGTHHAFPDHGEGFCVFNDLAVTIRTLQAEGCVRRAAVIDCDVHHGNGTAAVFAGDDSVYTLSLHGARNYPLHKPPGTADVPLADGTGDAEYLAALDRALGSLFERFIPDLVLYQAGVDPYGGDRLGRLGLSLAGLARRDRHVLAACRSRRVPVAITLGGGYAREVADTVEAHANTLRVARALY
jgi:acetoin utilization deacetylase AcuC-like enzyme